MASSSGGLFGWELLYRSVQNDIKNSQDILVCFTHLVLISNGFKCIGLGDSKILEGTETKTETLPSGWNDNYAIRYVYQGRLYNLRATNVDDAIMINLIRVQERTVSMVQLNNRTVAQTSGTLEQMIPNHTELEEMIRRQLIDKVTVSTKQKDGSSQTQNESGTSTSGVGPDRPSPLLERTPERFSYPSLIDPVNNVGRSDLDPFGGQFPPLGRNPPAFPLPGGGGMLFEPPRGGGGLGPRPNFGVPPDSLPPGARFDPFRPPDPERPPRRNPGNDFPPPGFDDMYM
ncbi:proteasome inhibitor PI31 subunit [Agrilus planipennis]|uniref:Proteasome inhibitor PI31 subunit n=1 Tax=Agrilus planipennis TaxID=224129 RepID=A0A1W4WAU1_AGRPL|nr:proteasome inhibitor PI31 subunit [Agrilus planipennis]